VGSLKKWGGVRRTKLQAAERRVIYRNAELGKFQPLLLKNNQPLFIKD
jgi:hypothetical protein